MRFHLDCSVCLVSYLVLGLILPSAAKAQDSASGAEVIRTSCEHAAQTLRSGGQSTEKVQSIVTMQECGDSGAEILASYWRSVSLDSILLRRLAAVSARMNDRRIYHAARSVVMDPSRTESARLAALTVLVGGFDPSIAVTFPTPTKPMHSSYVATGFVSHPPKAQGPQRVGSEAKDDLISLLKQLARSDPNERIRRVAAELGPLLERRIK